MKEKTTEELLSEISKGHEANAEAIKGLATAEALGKATADHEKKCADIHEDLTKLEDAVKEKQKLMEAEMVKLKQGTGWKAEEAAEKQKEINDVFDVYLRKGNDHLSSIDSELREKCIREKSLIAGSSQEGGFLIIPDMANSILALVKEGSSLRPFATVISGSSSSWEQPVQTGRSIARYVGETEARTPTQTPTFGNFKVEANEIAADPQLTKKLLNDNAFNVQDFLITDASEEISLLEGEAHFKGAGVNEPQGFLTLPDGSGFGEIAQIAAQSSGEIVYDDLVNMNVAPKRQYRGNARWMSTKETIGALRKIVDLEGRPLLQPDLPNGGLPSLFGRPVEEAFDMPQIGAAGTLPLVYGDFRQAYLIYDRQGIEILRDPYTNKPFIIFSMDFRSGGGVRRGEALKLLKMI